MAEIKAIHGDSRDVLKGLVDNSIDAVLTDPPYALVSIAKRFSKTSEGDDTQTSKRSRERIDPYARTAKGFMGKDWDNGQTAFAEEFWQEVYRVLKPGGHMLVFGGTRTFHRLVCAIEDAGFEIRDTVAWVYGCLSEDTKIVTEQGLRTYDTIQTNDKILCFDKHSGKYEYMKAEELFVYQYEDTAYRIRSDSTDQIVSRNHRCLIERDGDGLCARQAEELQETEIVPVLEGLPNMPDAVSNIYSGAGISKQNLFKKVFGKSRRRSENRTEADRTMSRLNPFRMLRLRKAGQEKQEEVSSTNSTQCSLQPKMQRGSPWGRLEKIRSYWPRTLEIGKREEIEGTYDRRNKSGMERWSNLSQQIRQSFRKQVCLLSERVFGNGESGRLCYGTPFADGYSNRQNVEPNRVCPSYQSHVSRQSNRKLDVVSKQQRTQTIRTRTPYRTSLATVTSFDYKGIMWCVTVPTGMFVAIRNGQYFLTGNSGFPKSHNISVAIDKYFGKDGEVVGTKVYGENHIQHSHKSMGYHGNDPNRDVRNITVSATEEAKQWQGYGSAIKPAFEPICLARKPLIGTIAENVLEHGVGGLNIDGCRVALDGPSPTAKRRESARNNNWDATGGGVKASETDANGKIQRRGNPETFKQERPSENLGRWPANLILSKYEEMYELRENITKAQRKELYDWLSENS